MPCAPQPCSPGLALEPVFPPRPRFAGRLVGAVRLAVATTALLLPVGAGADAVAPGEPVELDGTLPHYEAYAVAHSPALRAEHARWQASVKRVSGARSLPGPVLSFGYFVRSVETRVGPQRARLGIAQSFPWPTQLSAAAEVARAQVEAADRRLAARTLQLARQVDEAYWQLWLVRRAHALHSEHLALLSGLSEAARARLRTGASSVADQLQIDLTLARLHDQVASLHSAERGARARLRAALGAPETQAFPTRSEPGPCLPVGEPETALRAALRAHPGLDALHWQARASDARAEAERAERFPSFTVGVDWILTGEAPTAVADSGKDAIVVGGGVRLPLWQRGPREASEAARAEARASRAELEAARLEAEAELAGILADLQDGVRRAALYRDTLIPQAQSAFESVLGAYATGQATVSAALRAQQDLLALAMELDQTRARHAQGWARLEESVGRPVRAADPGTPAAAEENGHE